MSADLYAPHLLVIPEDEANRQIITGFRNHWGVRSRQIQIAEVANGWGKALKQFAEVHVPLMRKYPKRFVLILIDCDGQRERIAHARRDIPPELADRVFIMGSLTTPEKLAAAVAMPKETLGKAIADECHNQCTAILNHPLLVHNLQEWERMDVSVCPALWAGRH